MLLFVDDESIARKYFKALYGDRCEIEVADSAEQAREILKDKAHHIDLVICDYLMTGENGLSLLKHCQTDYPSIRRVLVSAVRELEFDRALKEGLVETVLAKPFQDSDIYELLVTI